MESTDLVKILEIAEERPLSAEEIERFNDANMGLDKHLGLRFTHVAADRVAGELHVTTNHLQPFGLVNGGVYAAMAESLGSFAGCIASRKLAVGVNNSTDFVRSVKAGVICGEATPLHLGRTTQLWQIVMTHADEVVARCTLRTMLLEK